MSTGQTWQTESTSLQATLKLAAAVGSKLRGGEVIELVSDLGGGKTAFVRGLAQGMGYKGLVRSPSFTLRNQYPAGDLTLYHFDFYRLSEPGIMRDELAELLDEPGTIIAVEWADIINDILPDGRLTINITAATTDTRSLQFTIPDELKYLMPDAAS